MQLTQVTSDFYFFRNSFSAGVASAERGFSSGITRKPRQFDPPDATRGAVYGAQQEERYLSELFQTISAGSPGLEHEKINLPGHTSRDNHQEHRITYRSPQGVPLARATFILYDAIADRELKHRFEKPPPALGENRNDNFAKIMEIGRRDNSRASVNAALRVISKIAEVAKEAGAMVMTESPRLAAILRKRHQVKVAPSEKDRQAAREKKPA